MAASTSRFLELQILKTPPKSSPLARHLALGHPSFFSSGLQRGASQDLRPTLAARRANAGRAVPPCAPPRGRRSRPERAPGRRGSGPRLVERLLAPGLAASPQRERGRRARRRNGPEPSESEAGARQGRGPRALPIGKGRSWPGARGRGHACGSRAPPRPNGAGTRGRAEWKGASGGHPYLASL